jgi:predicted enzyme related to lactoylglutathione lyase
VFALWLRRVTLGRKSADGHTMVSAPVDGPFGRTFTFADPEGYQVTLHDRA